MNGERGGQTNEGPEDKDQPPLLKRPGSGLSEERSAGHLPDTGCPPTPGLGEGGGGSRCRPASTFSHDSIPSGRCDDRHLNTIYNLVFKIHLPRNVIIRFSGYVTFFVHENQLLYLLTEKR